MYTSCCTSCQPFIFVSFIRQGVSPVGHCSGTAWHMASVLLLLLPSFLITRCSGTSVYVHVLNNRTWFHDLQTLHCFNVRYSYLLHLMTLRTTPGNRSQNNCVVQRSLTFIILTVQSSKCPLNRAISNHKHRDCSSIQFL